MMKESKCKIQMTLRGQLTHFILNSSIQKWIALGIDMAMVVSAVSLDIASLKNDEKETQARGSAYVIFKKPMRILHSE